MARKKFKLYIYHYTGLPKKFKVHQLRKRENPIKLRQNAFALEANPSSLTLWREASIPPHEHLGRTLGEEHVALGLCVVPQNASAERCLVAGETPRGKK